jgi:hypothetical protein
LKFSNGTGIPASIVVRKAGSLPWTMLFLDIEADSIPGKMWSVPVFPAIGVRQVKPLKKPG